CQFQFVASRSPRSRWHLIEFFHHGNIEFTPRTPRYHASPRGGLAPNGKSALLAQRICEDGVNAKGGLLGGPVRLVYYNDQSNPSTRSISFVGYGTNLLAHRGGSIAGNGHGRAGSYPLRRFRQKTDCESAHGEHVDWESAERILLQRKYTSSERGASGRARLELRAIFLYRVRRVGGFLCAGKTVHRPLENGDKYFAYPSALLALVGFRQKLAKSWAGQDRPAKVYA